MVDWQFTVFCREVGFVEIYAFLVLIFLAKNVSLLFLLLFPSLVIGILERDDFCHRYVPCTQLERSSAEDSKLHVGGVQVG